MPYRRMKDRHAIADFKVEVFATYLNANFVFLYGSNDILKLGAQHRIDFRQEIRLEIHGHTGCLRTFINGGMGN